MIVFRKQLPPICCTFCVADRSRTVIIGCPWRSAWPVTGNIVGGVLMSQVVAVAMALMKNVLDFTKIFHYFRLFSESRSTFASRQGPAYSLDMRHTLGHVLLR